MSRRIIGNTVGTPISPAAIERKIKPVKTINGIEADQNGNVDISEEVAALCEHSTIVTTAKGESILLTDSAKAKLRGLVLYGKSEQFTTTGANLLNIEDKTIFENGVTAVCKGGVITCSGTATAQATLVMLGSYNGMEDVCGLPTGTYYAKDITIQIMLANGDVNFAHNGYFDIAEGDYVCFVYRQFGDGEVVNETTYPMIFTGTTIPAWEPYTGGKPSPSPEYPQEIVSAGADGEIGVMFGGKNLLPIYADKASVLGITRELQADGSYKFTGTSTMTHWTSWINLVGTVPANGVYTFTADADVFTSRGLHFSHKRDGKELSVFAQARKVVYTAEMLKGDTVGVMLGTSEGEVVNCTVYAWLELGSTATDFEKPKDTQTLTVLTPNGLHADDYIDFARGVRVQRRVEEKVGVATRVSTTATGMVFVVCNSVPALLDNGRTADVSSNRFEGANYTYGDSGNECITIINNAIRFYLSPERGVSTLEGVNALMQEWEDEGKPLTIEYVLAEPIETPLSAEELAQYAALHTNYPTTTILNDEGVGMEVSYVADTKNYIDKKFTELAAAIVANA